MSRCAYSKIQHLADALFFSHDPRSRYFFIMTSYTGYFDTAGVRNQGNILVSGGFVASVDQWKNFDGHWKAILDKAGIHQFHMTDFINGEGEFSDPKWKKNDGYADNFLKKLVNAICKPCKPRTPIYAPTITINLDIWRELNKDYKLKESGMTPLALAAGSCIGMAYAWCLERGISPDHVECFHEDGDLDKGTLINMMKDGLGIKMELNFRSKELRPLQASDLLVWEAAYPSKQQVRDPAWNGPFRPAIEELNRRLKCDHKTYNVEGWKAVCASYQIPKRTPSVSLSVPSDIHLASS